MSKQFRGLISELEANRTALLEFVFTAVLLAFAISLLANWVYSLLPVHLVKWVGAGVLLSVAVYWSFRQFGTLKQNFSYDGFLLIDQEARAILSVEGYELCEDAHSYLTAAFVENPALKSQWERGRLGIEAMSLRQAKQENPTQKLVYELLEYVVLDRLSVHLSDFFSDSGLDKQLLRTYERNDIPEILLRNRFLELFSRPMKDRPSFKYDKHQEPTPLPGFLPGEVFFQTGEGGAIYSRFELILPARSTVRALPEGGFEIDGPAIRLAVEPTFPGYAVHVPPNFLDKYVGRPQFRSSGEDLEVSVAAYGVTFNVRFSPKFRGVFSRTAWKYHRWVDSFCRELDSYASSESFFDRIQWPTVEAVLRCLSPHDSGKPNATGRSKA